jgi:hypothetical protein
MVSDSKCSFTNSDDEMKPPGKLELNSNSGFNTPGEIKNNEFSYKRKKSCKTPT